MTSASRQIDQRQGLAPSSGAEIRPARNTNVISVSGVVSVHISSSPLMACRFRVGGMAPMVVYPAKFLNKKR